MQTHNYHSRWVIRRLFSLIALVLVAIIVFGINSLIYKDYQSKTALASVYSAVDVINSVNNQRGKNGLSSLRQNQLLMNAARNKANDMIANNYFAHISPVNGRKWSSFIRESGYDYIEAGENLANGFDNLGDLVQAWMDSPTHRENILNPGVDETGVAVRQGMLDGYETIYVVQVFGKRDGRTETKTTTASSRTSKTTVKTAVKPNTQTTTTKLKAEEPKKQPIPKDKKVVELLSLEFKSNLRKGPVFQDKSE